MILSLIFTATPLVHSSYENFSFAQSAVLTLPITGAGMLGLRLDAIALVDAQTVEAHVHHGHETNTLFDPSRVALWKATSLDGHWSGFLAFAPSGGLGWLESNGQRLVLMGSDANPAPGLRAGPWRFESEGRPSAPPVDEVCKMLTHPEDEGSTAGAAIPGVNLGTLPRLVELAIDADYEFTSMFASPAATIDYIIALYGANSYILERDCNTRLKLSYIRIFESADDFYNEPNPLEPFRNEWNANQKSVTRDLAQLLTGRRNLPYGGVAWLNAACTNYGYSVSGYMIGSFADSTVTNPGNWDVIVSTHELGHNIGTLHTHNYGIDSCASGSVQRGTIMSYCHIVSGATSNIDLRFHRGTAQAVVGWEAENAPCLASDCNLNGMSDADEIATGAVIDSNQDGIPDLCQDCDSNGILDPVQIAAGAADVDTNGRPDGCDTDCNQNGIPDLADIAIGVTADDDGNFIPDSCQLDCDSNGVADGVDLIVDVSRDIDRDGRIDSCEDCNGNNVGDLVDLAGALGLWTIQSTPPLLIELDGRSGVRRRIIDPVSFGIESLTAIETADDDTLLIGAMTATEGALYRFNRSSAQLTRLTLSGANFPRATMIRLVPGTTGSLAACDVLDEVQHRISRWRLSDGASLGTIAQLPIASSQRAFARQNADYLVVNADGTIIRMVGPSTAFPFAQLPTDSDPSDILVTSSGRILVADRASDSIQGFTPTGTPTGRFDLGPVPTSTVALIDPQRILTARQNAEVIFALASGATAAVHGFRLSDGYYLRTYRIYRVDAIGSDDFAQIGSSLLDGNMNFEIDICEGMLVADINGDGQVNGIDLATLLSAWGSNNYTADINHDGIIDGRDLSVLLAAWTG